jgi:hypothetical protein
MRGEGRREVRAPRQQISDRKGRVNGVARGFVHGPIVCSRTGAVHDAGHIETA